jgi:tellurite resistance protein TehA-like permease
MPEINPRLLLEWGYWFNGNPGPPTPITYALLVLFLVVLAAALVVWLRRRRLFPGQRIKTRLAAQLGPWFVGIAATGVFLMLLRVAEFPILSGRILWLLCLVALVGFAAYLVFYMTRRYPSELARLAREEERQRWVPKPRPRRGKRR